MKGIDKRKMPEKPSKKMIIKGENKMTMALNRRSPIGVDVARNGYTTALIDDGIHVSWNSNKSAVSVAVGGACGLRFPSRPRPRPRQSSGHGECSCCRAWEGWREMPQM